MKKFFITFIMSLFIGFGIVNAQVEPAKFFDNTSIALKGGVVSPMYDFGKIAYGNVGVEIEKGLTPWLGVAVEGNFMPAANDEYDTHTAFDFVNVTGLVKFNVVNMFGKFNGQRRVFEPLVFTGLGWGHYTCSDAANIGRNMLTYKAGVDFDFNVGREREWTIRVEPAVFWSVNEPFKLNKYNGMVELNVGVVYHFRNHDGNRTFTMVERYDQAEIDNLNGLINRLREENARVIRENETMTARLAEVPTQVEPQVVERVDTVLLMPRVQFYVNSARLNETTLGNVVEMAEYMKANPDKHYQIVGYASVEGDEVYNLKLSERRAEVLRDKLVELGVDTAHLETVAGGATDQFSEDCRILNRVVIVEETR